MTVSSKYLNLLTATALFQILEYSDRDSVVIFLLDQISPDGNGTINLLLWYKDKERNVNLVKLNTYSKTS